MVYRLSHIISVGTSIIRNSYRLLKENPRLAPDSVMSALDKCVAVRPGSKEDYECYNLLSGFSELHGTILQLLREDPRMMSAEINAMWPWLGKAEERPEYAEEAILLATETSLGALAGRILKNYLSDRLPSARVSLRTVPGWEENVMRGIVNLYLAARDEVRKLARMENTIVMMNATGGFKPEATFLVMAGLHYAPEKAFAYYIHELHRVHTVIPLVHPETKSFREAVKLVTRELQAQTGPKIRIPLTKLERLEWLERYAKAVEPLGIARLTSDAVI
ncbi:MAG: putative CRISPR-associated protein, partial [Desulfurococcales archaeon]|nr:putative CRISPR-associated protein [Desulfurococcales archaeon]